MVVLAAVLFGNPMMSKSIYIRNKVAPESAHRLPSFLRKWQEYMTGSIKEEIV